ncbi:hypothetical protein BV20DRAFT_962004 [Pilatotrama ljubarskyi]|nr:hypothetical protein BV20DRAFT_962004 [Pilatotrama ljubarskyi]
MNPTLRITTVRPPQAGGENAAASDPILPKHVLLRCHNGVKALNEAEATKIQGDLAKAQQDVAQGNASAADAYIRQLAENQRAADRLESVKRWIKAHPTDGEGQYSFADWKEALERERDSDVPQDLAKIILAVAMLREASGRRIDLDIDDVWRLVYPALLSPNLPSSIATSRGAQGFLKVKLFEVLTTEPPKPAKLAEDGSIIEDEFTDDDGTSGQAESNVSEDPTGQMKPVNRIDEQICLNVWLPDGKRGAPDFHKHAHQCWAQSWILAGQAVDHRYQVRRSSTPEAGEEMHDEYGLIWYGPDGKFNGDSYVAFQSSSDVGNRGIRICAKEDPKSRAVHTRGMSYTIPEDLYHHTDVAPIALHATFFYFDGRRGFCQHAGILGPVGGTSNNVDRDAGGVTTVQLATITEALRSSEPPLETLCNTLDSIAGVTRSVYHDALKPLTEV